jgi:hypothetical protein
MLQFVPDNCFVKTDCTYVNASVERLLLTLCIRELLASNLGPETGLITSGFKLFSSVPLCRYRVSDVN